LSATVRCCRPGSPHRSSLRRQPLFSLRGEQYRQFLALLSYPFIVEPFSTLGFQRWPGPRWFIALIALIGWSGLLMLPTMRSNEPLRKTYHTGTDLEGSRALGRAAAVPSALLISGHRHILDRHRAAPFMWVVPLALYLLTSSSCSRPGRSCATIGWSRSNRCSSRAGRVMVFDIRSYLFGILALRVVRLRHHAGLPRRN